MEITAESARILKLISKLSKVSGYKVTIPQGIHYTLAIKKLTNKNFKTYDSITKKLNRNKYNERCAKPLNFANYKTQLRENKFI